MPASFIPLSLPLSLSMYLRYSTPLGSRYRYLRVASPAKREYKLDFNCLSSHIVYTNSITMRLNYLLQTFSRIINKIEISFCIKLIVVLLESLYEITFYCLKCRGVFFFKTYVNSKMIKKTFRNQILLFLFLQIFLVKFL